jgi:hypothetical protein
MTTTRIRVLLAATAVAAVLVHSLSGHGLPQMSGHEGLAGAGAALCLVLATALRFAAAPKPEADHAPVLRQATPMPVGAPPRPTLDGRARASPSALQRFRN